MSRLRLHGFSAGYETLTPSWTGEPGPRTGLAGESGSGKTTLLTAFAGLLPPEARTVGAFSLEGKAGYVPQDPSDALSPFLRVLGQVADAAPSPAEAAEWLTRLGLGSERIHRSYPHELSGGERQRAVVAQVLASRPGIILADEPVSQLDEASAALVLAAFRQYCEAAGAELLIVSHDETVFDRLDCRVHRLNPRPELRVEPPAPVPSGAPEVVQASGVAKSYRGIPALAPVSLSIRAGETVALTGPSGAGKSTLARCLAGREAPDAGRIERGKAVQLVPQGPSSSLNPRFTVAEALAEASPHAGAEALAPFELDPSILSRKTSALSEGQRARLAVARAVAALDGGLLILDESLSGLDSRTASSILGSIRRLQRETGLACLLITHDAALARAAAHRVCHLVPAGRV